MVATNMSKAWTGSFAASHNFDRYVNTSYSSLPKLVSQCVYCFTMWYIHTMLLYLHWHYFKNSENLLTAILYINKTVTPVWKYNSTYTSVYFWHMIFQVTLQCSNFNTYPTHLLGKRYNLSQKRWLCYHSS